MQRSFYFENISLLHREFSWHLFLFAALVFIMLLAVHGCEKHESARSQQAQGPVEVAVVTVEPHDEPIAYEFIAQVQSSRQVNIQARVSDFLDKRVYTEGTIVKEGQTLFLMDQKPFLAQLDRNRSPALGVQLTNEGLGISLNAASISPARK